MLWVERIVALLLALLAVCPLFAHAEDAAVSASTFYLAETETQFSVNIANDSSDVFIYFTSPAYSWVGVGFGEGMANSFMLIMYPSKDGNNLTISPRIATDHSEPSVTPDVQLETQPGTGIVDEMFVLKAICRDCRVWPSGFLNVDTTAQPMIYAFGPGNRLQSDALDAPLKRHIRYGKFTMNMKAATGKGGVPAASSAMSGVEMIGGLTRDHDRANLAHAVLGSLALFVLWPLNLVLAGFLRKIGIHVGMSVFILVFLVIAYALGISTSHEYNRSKAFTSPHQIFAFIALLPILLLSILPIKPIASLSPKIPRLHAPLTTLTFVLLVVTGGLGLHLSSSPRPIALAYGAIALLAFAFITLLQMCIRRRGSAYARATTRRRLGEDDEQTLVLANRSTSAASSDPGSVYAEPGHARSASANGGLYGGGTMPGPQYLMNMHPGVPVHRW
ncbi:iron reductase domain protein [Melanomma pulvis-pyrius CBS 109.77]|uniref:Iron reductase domain protein n=1 Tax=Melanomma pulvis-pyrius CBS 109.77 TaxID=1314802 RepID=A0A6A6X9A1_9PLEO|nr:iron reductase domain protein [Melanomma pulvis-pyrius CBS 109.77]